jgi:hypothetical protein
MSRAIALVLLAALALLVSVARAPSAEAKPCGDVRANGQVWVVGGGGVGCKFQRRWTKRYLEHGDEPRGWRCVGRSRPGHGGCNEKGGDAFFVFYPPD